MKKLYVAAWLGLGLAGPAAVRAQADFRPGYIVRPAGDTVRGDIDYRDRQAALLARYETYTGWGSGQGLNTWSNRFYALLTLGLTK